MLQTETTIDFETIIPKFDAILARGLCAGVGDKNGQMCIGAAICVAMDLPFGDEPACVSPAVRAYQIALNDSRWSSPAVRAAGLRNLGIAQIGSNGVVDGVEFSTRLAENYIRVLLPALFRQILSDDEECMRAADRCEAEGSSAAAYAAAAHTRAAHTRAAADQFLLLSASLALAVLRELGSPGCVYIDGGQP